MTPQERTLVIDLFDRLAEAEGAERDPEAERVIGSGLRRAPNAVYTLVQTALFQDEALKQADIRIRDLEMQLDQDPPRPRGGSFLAGMGEASTGRRGSGPTALPADASAVAGTEDRGPPPPISAGPGSSKPGGSFLGTAAGAAAGALGGSLMLESIRSMLGQRQGTGGFGSAMLAGRSGPGASAATEDRKVAREAGRDDTRPGNDEGSSHGDDQADEGNDQDQDEGQHHEDFDDGSEDFEDSEDFDDDGGDFGGDDEA